MTATSLPEFIKEYRASFPDDVFMENGEVDITYEPTAYYKLLEAENPLILLNSLKGYDDFRLVTNTLGSKRRMAFALGTDENSLYGRWDEIMANSSDPRIVAGSCGIKEVMQTGEQIDLFSLPAPVHFSMDGEIKGFKRYITGGLAIARDPLNNDTVNMSFTRIQIIGKDRYAFDMGSHGHLWKYVDTAKKVGKNLPLTVLIGAHPLFYMLAASFIENEYAHAAYAQDFTFAAGEFNDLPVPSNGEIAIEAEVQVNENFSEGPFSEFTGYMSSRSTGNVASVKAIMRKKNPIFYDISASNSHEHVGLFSIPRNASIIRGINRYLPPSGSYQLDWPFSSSHLVAMCNVANPEPGLSKQLGLAVIGLDSLFTKIAFVSEGGSSVPDLEKALLGLSRGGPEIGKNLVLIPGVFTIKLDPSSSREGTNGKAILVFDGKEVPYEKSRSTGKTIISAGDHCVAFSRGFIDECNVNVLLDDDIDTGNPESVMWAIATRTKPDSDFRVEKGKLFIDARAKSVLQIPELPPAVLEKVGKVLKSNKN